MGNIRGQDSLTGSIGSTHEKAVSDCWELERPGEGEAGGERGLERARPGKSKAGGERGRVRERGRERARPGKSEAGKERGRESDNHLRCLLLSEGWSPVWLS